MTRLPRGPSATPRFESEDDEGRYYLSLLRDGGREEQLYARDALARIFANREMLDEAAELYETNIVEGVRDAEMYRRLASVYRRQGKHDLAEEVLVEAERLDAASAAAAEDGSEAFSPADADAEEPPRSSWRSRWQASVLEPLDEDLPPGLDEDEEPDDIPPPPRRTARSEEVEKTAHERVLRSVAAHTARARSAAAADAGGGRLGGIVLGWLGTLALVLLAYLSVGSAPLSAVLYLLAALVLLIVVASPLDLRVKLRLPTDRGTTRAAILVAVVLAIAALALTLLGPAGNRVNLIGPAAPAGTAAPHATIQLATATATSSTADATPPPADATTESAPTVPPPDVAAASASIGPLAASTPQALGGGDVAESRLAALSTLGTVTPTECSSDLGFAALRTKLGPDTVGDCYGEQSVGDNGDIHQPTTKGELVGRKSDGRTAYTDGYQTWIDGPNGIEKRLNGDRFVWESEPAAATPTATPFPLPTPLAGALIPQKRVVAYYGNPLSDQMGVLGEGAPEQMLERLKQQCQAWQDADPSRPVQPALQLVAVVAQGYPGDDNKYRLRMSEQQVNQVLDWAERANAILILDIQPGRSSVKEEVEWARPFLKRPNVHLALDPEFTQRQDQVPGEVIGSMDASAINDAVQILDEVVQQDNLPPKILIVHRFTDWMVTDYRDIRGQNPRVQVVMDMDGFGSPQLKVAHYDKFVIGERVAYTGLKLFYTHDDPLMDPKQVLQLEPPPDVVIYQ